MRVNFLTFLLSSLNSDYAVADSWSENERHGYGHATTYLEKGVRIGQNDV